MRTAFPLLSLLVVVACGEPEEVVVAEMERALTESNHALAVQLLATELVSHTFDEPDNQLRHGEACGCPCLDRTGTPPEPYALLLEYEGAGCLPESGLLPTVLGGEADLEVDEPAVEVSLLGVQLNLENAVDGALSASVTPDGEGFVAELTGSLDAGPHPTTLDTTVVATSERLEIAGTITVTTGGEATELTFDEVVLPIDDIGGPCPDPSSGQVTMTADDEVVLDYGRPGGGFVELTRKNRVSEQVDLCAYRSDLL